MLILLLRIAAFADVGLFFYQRHLQHFPPPRRLGPTASASAFRRPDALPQLGVRPRAGPGAVLYFDLAGWRQAPPRRGPAARTRKAGAA